MYLSIHKGIYFFIHNFYPYNVFVHLCILTSRWQVRTSRPWRCPRRKPWIGRSTSRSPSKSSWANSRLRTPGWEIVTIDSMQKVGSNRFLNWQKFNKALGSGQVRSYFFLFFFLIIIKEFIFFVKPGVKIFSRTKKSFF